MSKSEFDRMIIERLRSNRVTFSSARRYGPAVIHTNRLVDMHPDILALPHSEVACDECGEMCVLHPLSLKVVPEAKIMCGHCAAKGFKKMGEPSEVIVHPEAVLEMLADRWRKR